MIAVRPYNGTYVQYNATKYVFFFNDMRNINTGNRDNCRDYALTGTDAKPYTPRSPL